uniref:M23 family metallopeptidase n=1 Tax=Acinetobacter baumannii TaxID=470 RepID=UPI001F2C04AD
KVPTMEGIHLLYLEINKIFSLSCQPICNSAHKRGLNVGDYVKKGDLIGYVGNTGNARYTSPHLHYGLYLDGKGRGAVNPYSYLR